MKKILVLLVFFSFAVPQMNAQPEWRPEYKGVLRVRLEDNYPITVALDGRYFQKHGPRLTIGDLPTGRHYLKIYTFTPQGGADARAHLVYEGKVRISGEGITNLVYDPVTGAIHTFIGEDNNYMEPGPGEMRGRKLVPESSTPQNTIIDTMPAIKPVEKKFIPPTVSSKPPYPALNKKDMDKLGTKVKARITDTDKLKDLQASMAKKALNTQQLKVILTWLNFESSRVDFAKWSYNHTTDKQNYNDIVNDLIYKESKDELIDYLNAAK